MIIHYNMLHYIEGLVKYFPSIFSIKGRIFFFSPKRPEKPKERSAQLLSFFVAVRQ